MIPGPVLLLGALFAPFLAAAPASAPASEAPRTEAQKPKPAKAATKRPALPAASLPTLEGEVAAIDHRVHQLRVRTPSGEVTLSFDRDTLVRDATGAATPLRITPGAKVRIGKDGEARAAWVEVSPTPRQGP